MKLPRLLALSFFLSFHHSISTRSSGYTAPLQCKTWVYPITAATPSTEALLAPTWRVDA
jgi:hypothetical protein